MPNILALDTSSDNCSVALYQSGELALACELAPRKHTQLILPMVQSILDEQGLALEALDAIAFGCGPGSFTGIRIAAGVAQGLAFGLDCSVYAISNLEAMALQSYREHGVKNVLVAIDARMNEVYWSLCSVQELESSDSERDLSIKNLSVSVLVGEHVSSPADVILSAKDSNDLLATGDDVVGIGSGFDFITDFPLEVQEGLRSFDAVARPKADTICELAVRKFENGEPGSLADAMPSYVRDTVTWKKLPGRE